jgi:putative addiction module killer protein
MLPTLVGIEEYVDPSGFSAFGDWFDALPPVAAAKVTVAISRMARGAVSNVKGVGDGVLEYRIDSGPGYRIYFGRDGEEIVILLAGGTKKRQQNDIDTAQERWRDYKRRKGS